jgi:transposase-like protein
MEATLSRPHERVATPPEKPKRRRFSAEHKLRILEEADRCTKPGELGLLLRREGLYSSHLAEWRRWRRRTHPEHPESQKPATESQLKHDLDRLQRENARLRLKLDHAEKLAALQKKFQEMLEAQESSEIDGSSA